MASLTDFLFSGVLVRFPTLKLAYTEGQIGWIPYILERADDVWREHRAWGGVKDLVPEPPSTYYYRQCSAASSATGTASSRSTGSASTTSRSRPTTRTPTRRGPTPRRSPSDMVQDLPDDAVYKIMRGNAIRMLRSTSY